MQSSLMSSLPPPSPDSIRAHIHDINGQLFIIRASAEMLALSPNCTPDTLARSEKILLACEKISALTTQVGERARQENL